VRAKLYYVSKQGNSNLLSNMAMKTIKLTKET